MTCGPLIALKEDILMKRGGILIPKLYGGLGIGAVMDILYKKECRNSPINLLYEFRYSNVIIVNNQTRKESPSSSAL
jgi:hypothetical protein